MSNECKLCVLLGSTLSDISEKGGNFSPHSELHARQSWLINHSDSSVPNRQDSSLRNGKYRKERNETTRLVQTAREYCRELVDIHGKDGGVKCSQCQTRIQLQKWIGTTANRLINHACIHLNKDLFACRQCDLKFISRLGIDHHLRRIHALSGIRANYIDMTDDHRYDIMHMVKLCFGKAPQKQLNVTEYGKQKRNYQRLLKAPLRKLAFSLLSKLQNGDGIQCHQCSKSIPHDNRGHGASKLIDHACWHLDKPILTCGMCQYSASTYGTIKEHFRRRHSMALPSKNFKDGSNEYYDEISSIIEDCFGQKKETPIILSKVEGLTWKAKNRILIKHGTNSLQAERHLRYIELMHKFQRCGSLQCRICHERLRMTKPSNVQIPMQHVFSHFNRVLFSCRRCSYSSTTKGMMGAHLRSKHGVYEKNEFDDRTNDFHSDFMDMLSKCYDWDLEPEGSICTGTTAKNEKVILVSRSYGNDLKAARLVHINQLVTHHAKDGAMICRICSCTKTTTRKSGRRVCAIAFSHALTHLQKKSWPYRCRLCSYTASNGSTICRHLKRVHKKGLEKCENMSDKFHTEIMEIVSKCYDWGAGNIVV